jgi:hypothetical protein
MALDGTYTGLKASVADFLNRADLTSVIPDFITLAEGQMNRQLRNQAMLSRASLSIVSQRVLAPTDFVAPRSLRITTTSPTATLSYVSNEQMDELLDTGDFSSGTPKHYTLEGGYFRFSPDPGVGPFTGSLSYYAKLPALASNSTNWLLTGHPDAYLYGALTQSAPYLKDDSRISAWGSLFTKAMSDINASDDGMGGTLDALPSSYRNGGAP